ncbi:hypothetical protein [Streptomyces sp. TLI_146]|uniref:hypothetical protein n=1 Tax=Streptomyces sp. TLI_146 TaxID=1938858 RepID=UPI0015D61358|nr:hypothetical protein [Streptomyces sp. TLI_146]
MAEKKKTTHPRKKNAKVDQSAKAPAERPETTHAEARITAMDPAGHTHMGPHTR